MGWRREFYPTGTVNHLIGGGRGILLPGTQPQNIRGKDATELALWKENQQGLTREEGRSGDLKGAQ